MNITITVTDEQVETVGGDITEYCQEIITNNLRNRVNEAFQENLSKVDASTLKTFVDAEVAKL